MDVFKKLLAEGLDAGIAWAEADKATLLAQAAAAGINLETIAEKYADSVIANASLPAPFSFFPKSVIVNAVNNGIAALVNAGQAKESVLFDLIIAWAQSEAKSLGG